MTARADRPLGVEAADPMLAALEHVVPLLERVLAGIHEQAAALVKLEERIEAHGEQLADIAARLAVVHQDVEARTFAQAFGPK